MTESEALLILNAVDGLGPKTISKLLGVFGSSLEILKISKTGLLSAGLSSKVAENCVSFPKDKFLCNEKKMMDAYGVKFSTILDGHFPEPLKNIPDCPVVLYYKGDLKRYSKISIAVVGSRRASLYGLLQAERFSSRLCDLGVSIVSGMARGVDTAAHKGALKSHGLTIAVLGCGLSFVYPPENHDLMLEISRTGIVISEFPMGARPLTYNFPRRNRIISGLSLGTLVVEAAPKSGALITADFALEQGREVFAIPTNLDALNAGGVHSLLKQGAKLTTCVEDVLEELSLPIQKNLNLENHSQEIHQENLSIGLTNDQSLVYSLVTSKPVHIDDLFSKTRTDKINVNMILLELELKKLITQLPGHVYVRQ